MITKKNLVRLFVLLVCFAAGVAPGWIAYKRTAPLAAPVKHAEKIGAYLPDSWQTQYLVDFTSLVTQNIKTGGNGTKTIDGKSWTWANDASATSANLTNGTGIVVNPAANSGSAAPNARLGPILYTTLTSLMPLSLNVARHYIRLEARVQLTGATLASQGVRLGIESASAPTDCAISLFKGFSTVAGSTSQFVVQSSKPTATAALNFGDTTNFSDDVLVVDIEWPDAWEARTGAYNSGIPYSYANFRAAECLDVGTASPLLRLQAEPRVVLSWQDTNAGGGAFSGTVTHLRVSQANKWPG